MTHFLKFFNLANYFWTVSASTMIFHISISCDMTFPWVPLFFTLWRWPCSLTYFLKTLILLINFEQWVLELCYFTWVIIVTWPFRGYQLFFTQWHWPWSLTYFFKIFNFAYIFWIVTSGALIMIMSIPCDKAFHFFYPVTLTLWINLHFEKVNLMDNF